LLSTVLMGLPQAYLSYFIKTLNIWAILLQLLTGRQIRGSIFTDPIQSNAVWMFTT